MRFQERKEIKSSTDEAEKVKEKIVEAILEAQRFDSRISDRTIFGIRLAMEEALVNCIKHGNEMDATKTVIVECYITADLIFTIICVDEGKGFQRGKVPDATADENLERPCGRGTMLMEAFMDTVKYVMEFEGRTVLEGSVVVMTKDLTKEKESIAEPVLHADQAV